MDLVEAIQARKSIRGYKSTPVSKEVLTDILDLARLSPSHLNHQSWEFIVLTSESLEKAKRVNAEQQATGDMEKLPGIGLHRIGGPYRERRAALGKEMYRLMGIGRDDIQKRKEWELKGMQFFDAPAAILVCVDEMILNEGQMPLMDVGIVSQTIALLAVNYGLGTCIAGAPVAFPDALKKALDIPASKCLVLALAIGYPDWDFPANQLQTAREPLESLVTWKS